MNNLLFIRLVFTVLLAGPLLCLANTDLKEIDIYNGVNADVSIEVTMSVVKVRALSMQTLQSSMSFALSSLFTNVCGTLVSTFELVVSVLSYTFLTAGSELANDLIK